jgi:hypothetical protein
MSVAEEILEWSYKRHQWLRDALRRLATKEALSSIDIEELISMAREEAGLVDPGRKAPAPIPLTSSHLPGSSNSECVSLRELSDVQNVNALAPEQQLRFQPELTILYGDNATGKSGYVRILKKLCRARAADKPILPNVFSDEATGNARANLEFALGQDVRRVDWCDGDHCPSCLGSVSVFDSPSAAVYVNDENEIAYLPLGLDLLEKLAGVCDRIRASIEHEAQTDLSKLDSIPAELSSTSSGKWLARLCADTTTEQIDLHTTLSVADRDARERAERILAEPSREQRAAELQAKAERYSQLHARLTICSEAVTAKGIEDFERSHEQAKQASETALLAAAQRFADLPIPFVGTAAWERLWEAAEEFRRQIHAEHAEYASEIAKRCPLCQQLLDPDAGSRFESFADYFLAKANSDEAGKHEQFQTSRAKLIDVPLGEDLYSDVLKELQIDDNAMAHAVAEYLLACRNIRNIAVSSAFDKELPEIPTPPLVDSAALKLLITQLSAEVRELKAAADPDKEQQLRAQVMELRAEAWLADRREQAIQEVQRLSRIRCYERARTLTATTGITQKVTELTQRYVTDELRTRFTAELSNITSIMPRVRLVGWEGKKGVSYYRLQMDGPLESEVAAQDVLSEGELRAISLAAFLSELSTEETQSAAVLDDPISSLDIHNRERVAERLANLASSRQTIVFTHDLFFLACLTEAASRRGVHATVSMLQTTPTGAGIVIEESPVEAMKFNSLVGRLRSHCQMARARDRGGDVNGFNALRSEICTGLRIAVERAVEEVLLSGIVKRFRRQIYTSNIADLEAITAEDIRFLDTLMTRYSKLEHSQTPDSRVAPPPIEELETDVNALGSWAGEFNKRKARAEA